MAALTVEQALAQILSGVMPTATETVTIDDALGRTLAAPLVAMLTQPPFHASAMDGYAVRLADIAIGATSLRVIGEAAAGHPFVGTLGPRDAVRIFTGAPLPDGGDAVVIQEDCTRTGDTVSLDAAIPNAAHVRPRGSDFNTGDVLLAAGRTLGPRELALAACMGHGDVAVRTRPRVAIIATGDELVLPGQTPGPGQIVCSNHLGIRALCTRAGARADFLGIARDTPDSLDAHFARADGYDVVITIGGASVGDHDLVAPRLKARGIQLDFWKIAMRPGKPLMFARHGAQRYIGLPGNPVSSLICTRLFIVPLIRAMLGTSDAQDVTDANITTALDANGPRAHYMRATVATGRDGRKSVTAARSQDSSQLSVLAEANALIIRPIGAEAEPVDATVPIMMLDF
jgi:molybdopterin molybdotransferase